MLLSAVSEYFEGLVYMCNKQAPCLVGVIRLAVLFSHNMIKLCHSYCDIHHIK